MKKILIGLSGLVILAFIAVLFMNAKNAPQEVKKAATEVAAGCGACPAAAAGSAMKCDPAASAKD